MPAFIQHRDIQHHAKMAPEICPSCMGLLPMYVREIEPHWNASEINFVYECLDCGAEVRQTLRKPSH
jgi:RNase P subunit RPR2